VARRKSLAKPVKTASAHHGLDAFRGRTAAGAAGNARAKQNRAVKTAKPRTSRFRVHPIKHSAALARA
jgi:alkylation response protein AidB-like acyl-CoA dehydrogenase